MTMKNHPTIADIREAESLTDATRLASRLAAEADSPADLIAAFDDVAAREAALSATYGVGTIRAWQARSAVVKGLARLADDKGKGLSAERGQALLAEQGRQVGRSTVGRWLRSVKVDKQGNAVVTEARLAEAERMIADDDPDGPPSADAVGVLTWCEAKAGTASGSNRGQAATTKAEAEQAKAEAKVAADKAKAERITKGAEIAEAAKAKGRTKRYGLLTAKALAEATAEQLAETEQAIAAERAYRAKAEADAKAAKREAEKAANANAKAEAERIKAEAKAEAERIIAEAKAEAAKA